MDKRNSQAKNASYHKGMITYLRTHTARAIAILAAVGVAALSLLALAGSRDGLFHSFTAANKGIALADNSCTESQAQSDDVYFVSCGGFF